MTELRASRPRCVVVAAGSTALLCGTVATLGRVASGQPAGADRALVRLCLAALCLAVGWAWLQAMAGVAEAWRGARTVAPHGVRRIALVACGVALVGAVATPAQASPAGPHPDLLAGLPLPDRAEGPAGPAARQVVVRPGDTLWALAERRLDAPETHHPATDRQIADGWHEIYRRNRGVIGPDPDLIQPGEVLRIGKEQP